MRDFFRSRFFTVIVIVMLVLTIVPSVFASLGVTQYLKNGVNVVLTPLQSLFTSVTNAADGFVSYFTEFDRIVDENNALRSQITELQSEIYSAEELGQMNEWLYDYLELKREHTDYTFESANVTGREGGNYMTVFTLDKGTSQGVQVNMPVITADGIAGYITEAGTDWAKAVTILESGAAIGAYVERSGVIGVVEGEYSLSDEGLCKMSYLAADSDIQAGDRIISSGYGSVYPRGLVIGIVESIEQNSENRSIDVYVRPSCDFSDISKLMVITAYDTYTE